MLSKREPFEYAIAVLPGEVVNCQIKIIGDKKFIGKSINICIHVHYKTDPFGKGKSTNVACSMVGNILLDGEWEKSISLVAPDFVITNAVKSVVYISTDSFDGINISEVNIVKSGGTFVGGKGGGWVGADPLVPGLTGGFGGFGAASVGLDTDSIKKAIKAKFDSGGKLDVVCEGLMLGHSGFAKAMRNVTYGLDRTAGGNVNIKSVILDADCIGCGKTEQGRRILALSNNNNVGIGGGGFYITMNFPLGVRHHPGFYNIPYIMYETVDFPKVFVDHLNNNHYDEIWTPSQFCKESMVRGGLDGNRIFVMPLGVDTGMFSRERADEPRYIPGNLGGILSDKFKFLTVMGYSERKGVSILIRAFVEEFGLGNGGRDAGKVALYFKGGWYLSNKAVSEIDAMVAAVPGLAVGNRPLISFDFNIYPDDVLASLYKACDCFVLPSRGEGWSLPMCEAMSMGLPTIGTRWSGNLEFMTDENSYLLNIDGFAEEPRCNWITHYYIGQKFAVPSVTHLRKLLRHVYEHREEAIGKGRIARECMVKNFDWSVSCARARDRLIEIAKG